jgi:hypothetical protein
MNTKKISSFPSQIINNSLGNFQTTLSSVKSSLSNVVYDDALKGAIQKCIDTFQELIFHASSNSEEFQGKREEKTKQIVKLKEKQREGTITTEEQNQLDKLIKEVYGH